MSDMDLTRYNMWADMHGDLCEEKNDDGEYVLYDDVAPIIEEVKRLRAELESLRAQVPVWTTVTEDPGTLPEAGGRYLVKLIDDGDDDARREGPMLVCGFWGPRSFENEDDWPHFQQEYAPYDHFPALNGDRWSYVPEVQS